MNSFVLPDTQQGRVVLGSRSPRRRELLNDVIGTSALIVCPPENSVEAGFDDVDDDDAIRQRLLEIVRAKHDDVNQQRARLIELAEPSARRVVEWIIVADTTVVATRPCGRRIVLGQPPDQHWQETVSGWFEHFLSGRIHDVLTGVIVSRGEQVIEFVQATQVAFDVVSRDRLGRYLLTGESVGKAGGYAIQGMAAGFVRSVQGSLTNVIGLPTSEVLEALERLGWTDSAAQSS